MEGEFRPALKYLSALQDKPDGMLDDSDAVPLRAMADVQLMVGEYEEAEESYRRVQRAMRHDKERVRVESCRNTGWQALSQNRFSAALNCFSRNAGDLAALVTERIEAMVGVAMTHYRLGQQSAAVDTLELAKTMAMELPDPRWGQLLDCVFADFGTHARIRASGHLRDHAFWHSASCLIGSGTSTEAFRGQLVALGQTLKHMPLMKARVAYLPELLSLCDGRRSAYELAYDHANWARVQQFSDYYRAVKLEIALTVLAPGFVDLAEKAMDTTHDRCGNPSTQRWNIDQLYCMSKIRQQQGKVSEALELYCRYALSAIQCLRTETNVIKPLKPEMRSDASSPTDDVGARLPAKYRRAYRYMTENIDRSSLSIRDVAVHIGVTERALQLVFKEHLGLSPSEVIRRLRMEGIREELLDNANPSGGILETATRWGVTSRSTLISSYRKHFSETPSQTLQRI